MDEHERAAYIARERRARNGRPMRRAYGLVLRPDPLICGICQRPIDKGLPWRDPWSKTVDHIIAIIDGGSELDPANLQPAHRQCNLDKEAARKAAVAAAVRDGRADFGRIGGLQRPEPPRERVHESAEIVGGSP